MDLYVYQAATTSRAVLAFCDAANIDVTLKDVDLMKGEHRQPPFTTLNPNGLVPVLVDDGFVLTEASAILRYLANKTRSPLYPDDLRARARVDELVAWFEANFYKDFGFSYVYPKLMPHHARGSDEATKRTVEWGYEKSKSWLSVLDRHFLSRGRWLVGDELTIADFFGASIVSLGELVAFDLDAYPNVRRWYEAVTKHPSWVRINAPFVAFVSAMTRAARGDRMSLALSMRRGERPTTQRVIPHKQLDQTPSAQIYQKLVARFLALPGTSTGPSLVSTPGAHALFLREDVPCNHDAFFGGREFAHVHPASDGSFHMILSEADCAEVRARGWGELHPHAEAGRIQRTAVMIYAPRDDDEIATVLAIARAALAYASTPTTGK